RSTAAAAARRRCSGRSSGLLRRMPHSARPASSRSPAPRRTPGTDISFLGRLPEQTLFLLAKFRRQRLAEVLGLEHLPDLDLRVGWHRVGTALDPLDRLLLRFHLPQPEAGDELLRFGERSVDYRAFAAGEANPGTLAARLQPF